MSRQPDFIIIGAMKCATSTLHEQLAAQDGIFMSTPKEPNFFSDDHQWCKGMAWYESLFDGAEFEMLAGESSTHYTKWPKYPNTVERMGFHLHDEVKFIYIMRHPIDRLVSHYIHEWTQRVISGSINDALDSHPELIAYSQYAAQLQHYIDEFGEHRILPVFFERLAKYPQQELERVCEFIGYDGHPVWNQSISEQNVSSERLRQSPVRDALINLPGLKQVRRSLIPKRTREWVKGFWQMKERPRLSSSNLDRVRKVFDHDLAILNRWFGLDLTCDNFKKVATETAPNWQELGEPAA